MALRPDLAIGLPLSRNPGGFRSPATQNMKFFDSGRLPAQRGHRPVAWSRHTRLGDGEA